MTSDCRLGLVAVSSMAAPIRPGKNNRETAGPCRTAFGAVPWNFATSESESEFLVQRLRIVSNNLKAAAFRWNFRAERADYDMPSSLDPLAT